MRDSNPRKRSQSPVCYRYTNPLYSLGERSYYTQSFRNVKNYFRNLPDFFLAGDLPPEKRLFWTEGGPGFPAGRFPAVELMEFSKHRMEKRAYRLRAEKDKLGFGASLS